MYDIMAWCFPIWYFLKCCSLWVQVYAYLGTFFEFLEFFFHVIYPVGVFVMFFIIIISPPSISLLLESFSHQHSLVVFHWSLTGRILLNILANLNNAVIWFVSIRALISNSPSLSSKPFETVPTYDYHFTPLRVFHISVSWWYFSGVWVTASLLKHYSQYSGRSW